MNPETENFDPEAFNRWAGSAGAPPEPHSTFGDNGLNQGQVADQESATIQPTFVDLGEIMRNGITMEKPTIGETFDGQCLFYAGRINEIHAEPGVGKTNIACAAIQSVIRKGGEVLFIDPEDTPNGMAARLQSFGMDDMEVSRGIRYSHNPTPEEYLRLHRWAQDNQNTMKFVLCDGLAEALAAEGYNEDVPGDVLKFFRQRIRPFADAGATVLISDHVAKNAESRGRWPRGSSGKMGRYDGAVYIVSIGESYTPDKAGYVRLTIAKDRNGGVGPVNTTIAELHFIPSGSGTALEWQPPTAKEDFRPTCIMGKIEDYIRGNPGASSTEIREAKLGKTESVSQALRCLINDGKVFPEPEGRGKTTRHYLADEA